MRARLLFFCCLATLAGCNLPRNYGPPATPEPAEYIRLFHEHVLAEGPAIKEAVVARVSPGVPMAQATALLEGHGFHSCGTEDLSIPSPHPAEIHDLVSINRPKDDRPVYRSMRCDIHGAAWGRDYETILVVLSPDPDEMVRSIEVYESRRGHPYRKFFAGHPELQEPIDLPADEARARMQEHKFKCTEVAADEAAGARRCLYCVAYDEGILGGSMVQVRLFLDEAGVVRDSDIVRQAPWFEDQRCMLPDRDDHPAWFAFKTALFPVREATRASLVAIGYTIVFTLVGYSHGYCPH